MLRNCAIGVQLGERAVVSVAKISAPTVATIVGTAGRKYRDGGSTVVVSAGGVAHVLAARIDGLYDGLSIRTVVRPDGGSSASGGGGQYRVRESDSLQVCSFG